MLKIIVRLVVLMIAVGAGRLGYDKVANLPLFALEDVEVKTNGHIDPDSLVKISGLEKGKSIFKQDIGFAAEMISRQHGVASCIVDRGILSDIKIDVKFAEPRLLVSGKEVYGLSREGIVLPVSETTPDLPVVTGRKFKSAGRYGRLTDPEIGYALELFNTLNASSPGLCDMLSEIHFEGNDLLVIYFSPEGTRAVLDKRYSMNDLIRLCALKESGMLTGQRIFDLRFGDVVVESSLKKGTL